MVWRRHGDGVDVLVSKHLLHVVVLAGLISAGLDHELLAALTRRLIDVTDANNVDEIWQRSVGIDMVAASATEANLNKVDALIGAHYATGGQRRRCSKKITPGREKR